MANLDDVAYFNPKGMKGSSIAYVCWLDVMGASAHMRWSDTVGANDVFKLHNAVIRGYEKASRPASVVIYPVMDGTFIVSPKWEEVNGIVVEAMRLLSGTFLSEAKNHQFQSAVRGAISHGWVHHGKDITAEADKYLSNNPTIRDSIAVGQAMVRAHDAERKAGPFCVWIDWLAAQAHEGSRNAEPKEGPLRWFEDPCAKANGMKLLQALMDYYDWYDSKGDHGAYPTKKRKAHLELAAKQLPPPW